MGRNKLIRYSWDIFKNNYRLVQLPLKNNLLFLTRNSGYIMALQWSTQGMHHGKYPGCLQVMPRSAKLNNLVALVALDSIELMILMASGCYSAIRAPACQSGGLWSLKKAHLYLSSEVKKWIPIESPIILTVFRLYYSSSPPSS